ncbi:MAG: hypothetical protein VKS61_13305 [Candidatus Sericytochromatia bacterium]|nr:hypothetical protein [Candidatus Sericytochromatia bacterium]
MLTAVRCRGAVVQDPEASPRQTCVPLPPVTLDQAEEPWPSIDPSSLPATPRRRGGAVLGAELFGAPASPWGALLTPLPWLALALQVLLLHLGNAPGWPAAGVHATEALWLLWAPWWLVTVGHGLGRWASEGVFLATRGQVHVDASPRRWHYALAFAVCAAPLVVIQWHGATLEAYMTLRIMLARALSPAGTVHVGYDPSVTNLWVLAVFPLVAWQAGRAVGRIPPGRLLGLQRELARLRGELAWGTEAWGATVGQVIDRWLADLGPGLGEAPEAGESRRRQRQRWLALRRELVAAWVGTPPDLPRANRAVEQYRSGRLA